VLQKVRLKEKFRRRTEPTLAQATVRTIQVIVRKAAYLMRGMARKTGAGPLTRRVRGMARMTGMHGRKRRWKRKERSGFMAPKTSARRPLAVAAVALVQRL
jgi:hypothetical protein